MKKIRTATYSSGEKHWLYLCPGCGYEHAFGPTNHQFNGDVENPTISPSLLNNFSPDRICHSFIKEGKIQFLNDCWHKLAGQTVELPEVTQPDYNYLDEPDN